MTLLTARSGRRPRRSVTLAVVLLGGVLVACGGGDGDTGQAASPGAATAGAATPGPDGVIVVTADDLEFSTNRIAASAGEPFTIEFTNEEAAPHNIAIYTDESRSEAIFVGDVISGPGETIAYEIPALEPGEYYFHCDIHPEMNGTVVAG